jgi:hypothetical protein
VGVKVNVLLENPEGRRPLGRHRCKWELVIEWIAKKLGDRVLIHLV